MTAVHLKTLWTIHRPSEEEVALSKLGERIQRVPALYLMQAGLLTVRLTGELLNMKRYRN